MSYRRWNSEPLAERAEIDPMIGLVDKLPTQSPHAELVEATREDKSEDSTRHTSVTLDEIDSNDSAGDGKKELPRKGPGWGRGVVSDVKSTVGTHWISEMTNLNQKTIAVSFFLYFACIAPAITFGAIYAKATNDMIGAVEMILATAWCGIVYAFIGGQPMMINGGTGPVLAFTEILFKMSESIDVPFLTFNAWIGVWVCIYMLFASFTGLNRLIVYATRFTDEIFALLISTIFIINALGNPFAPVGVYYYFEEGHTSNDEYRDDPDYSYMACALLSLLVMLGTVWFAFTLRKVKFSPFLQSQGVRNLVTDFAVVTSIVIMTLIGNVLFDNVPLETLNVPETFAPTFSCCTDSCTESWPTDCPQQNQPSRQRPWLVDLFDLNGNDWVPFMAAGPALLAFILVFLDDGITWHLVNGDTYKLTHGTAYHYDTLIIGFMIAINSLIGLPWLVAATVRSLNHVHAMAEKTSDGKIVSVHQTRLSNLFIHLLVLASIFALDILKQIPMAVLYGVFLFMGLVSLGTNQFWGRILMFFMQPSKYPPEPYTAHMTPRRMHLFTAIQLLLFVLLYTVKAIKSIAIAFPIIIACCIPARLYVLPKIFSEQELIVIDSDDETIRAWLEARESMKNDEDDKKHELFSGTHEQDDDKDEDEYHHEDEEHEALDQVTPLPNIARSTTEANSTAASSNKKTPYVRKQRHKSASAPSSSWYPELSPPAVGPSTSDSNDDVIHTTLERQPRQRRTKSSSCPPHMLFAEAERHVSSNYFFG